MTARVGQKAPDFTAPSYYKGGFTPMKLSDFAGKWVLLCFYPGDFTFRLSDGSVGGRRQISGTAGFRRRGDFGQRGQPFRPQDVE